MFKVKENSLRASSAQSRRSNLLCSLLICIFFLIQQTESTPSKSVNVLLITLDTTRADHLGCYGYSGALTPTLDRLAKEGAKFETAYSSVPITLPAHAALLTGLYPFRTGVRDNGLHRLPASTETLAEALGAHGYHTAAFVSAAVLDRIFGLDQGFNLYDDNVRVGRPETSHYEERAASQVNDAVFAFSSKIVEPYFLWVHYYDPHLPYVPPHPFDGQFKENPYDGEIAFMDRAIGKLLEGLSAHKLLDHTMIVVAGDHGESLGDHGEKAHGIFLYDSAVRVPLIFHFPGVIKPRLSVRGLARLVDVFPTVLDYAGVKIPGSLDGSSLKGALRSGRTNVAELYEETLLPLNSFGWSPLFGIRTAEWHYIRAPRKELYKTSMDPQEKKDLSKNASSQMRQLEKKLVKYSFNDSQSTPAEISPELREHLASLGYVGSSAAAAGRLDPKDGIGLADQMERARDLAAENRLDEAIQILTGVLARNPENLPARTSLGNFYMQQRQFARAQIEYETALKYNRELEFVYFDLAGSLAAQGKKEEAAKNYEKTLTLNPRFVRAYIVWAQMELNSDNVNESERILDRALSQQVQDPTLFLFRGRAFAAKGDLNAAIRFFGLALQQNPEYTNAYSEMGHAYYELRQIDQSIVHYLNALSLEPNNASLLKTLGSIYLYDKNDRNQAREYFEKALTASPNALDAEDVREIIKGLSERVP